MCMITFQESNSIMADILKKQVSCFRLDEGPAAARTSDSPCAANVSKRDVFTDFLVHCRWISVYCENFEDRYESSNGPFCRLQSDLS